MTAHPHSDEQDRLARIRAELFTAVVGDVMDTFGLHHQFLPPQIHPLQPDMVVLGRAMPVLEADAFVDVAGGLGPLSNKPFGLMLEALDDLRPGEVYIANRTARDFAQWGELMSHRASHLGAAGAVVAGYARDTRSIEALGFPAFACGRYAKDQGVRGKVVDYRVPIEIGGVRIRPGDLVFGDLEGVLIVPQNREHEILEAAFEKARGEKAVERAIRDGMAATKAFNTYGIM